MAPHGPRLDDPPPLLSARTIASTVRCFALPDIMFWTRAIPMCEAFDAHIVIVLRCGRIVPAQQIGWRTAWRRSHRYQSPNCLIAQDRQVAKRVGVCARRATSGFPRQRLLRLKLPTRCRPARQWAIRRRRHSRSMGNSPDRVRVTAAQVSAIKCLTRS